jgi:hypothetical protein
MAMKDLLLDELRMVQAELGTQGHGASPGPRMWIYISIDLANVVVGEFVYRSRLCCH